MNRLLIPSSVIVLALLTACTGPAGATQPSQTPAYQPSAATDAQRWHPKHPLPTMQMSEEEKQQRRTRQLDQEREGLHLAPMPYPALVRWIYPEEQASVLVPCMKDKGFVVKAARGGTGIKSNPGAQGPAFGKALLECKAAYSVDPRIEAQNPAAAAGIVYDYWTEFLVPCLSQRGYTLSPLPSREVFVTNPVAPTGYPDGNEEVEKACPMNPPSQALLGETY